MTLDATARRTRRAVLASAVGGAAALAASQLARPVPALAVGVPVNLDEVNSGSATTEIGSTVAGPAVLGSNATPNTGVGVAGKASFSVSGTVDAPNIGVYGVAGPDPALPYEAYEVGVAGVASFSDYSAGVYGESDAGYGVVGVSTNGWGSYGGGYVGGFFEGVLGAAAVGDATGMQAHIGGYDTLPAAPTATALFASVAAKTQVGLDARGRVRFPDRSGRATIAAGKSYVDVTVASGVSSSMYAWAVLQTYRSGVYVAAVRPGYPSSGKIRIYLNKAVTSSTYISWFVLG